MSLLLGDDRTGLIVLRLFLLGLSNVDRDGEGEARGAGGRRGGGAGGAGAALIVNGVILVGKDDLIGEVSRDESS